MIRAERGGAGIARRGVQFGDRRIAAQRQAERMLASARADHQHAQWIHHVPRAYPSVGSETASLRVTAYRLGGKVAGSGRRGPGYRVPVGSQTVEGELRNRCPALLIETLQRHSYGLLRPWPDPGVRSWSAGGTKSRGEQHTVHKADNRQVGWNDDPKTSADASRAPTASRS